jgi:Spy/CpxP family protein refolding chaperone
MKRLIYFIIFLAFAAFMLPLNSYAQNNTGEQFRKHRGNTTPEERADFQTNRMKDLLNLSDEQTEKVREINLKYAKENQEVFKSEATREEKRDKLRDLHEQKENELKAVLSEEQYEKFRSERNEMWEHMKKRRNQ